MTGYPKKNGCAECVVYKIHHNQSEPELCPECGHKSLFWKQGRSGSLLVRCSRCWFLAAVETNTPCECDPIFHETFKLVIEPQNRIPDNHTILRVAKYLNITCLAFREMCVKGCVLEQGADTIDSVYKVLNENNIECSVIRPEDPLEKYPYYEKCNYPHSRMRKFISDANQGEQMNNNIEKPDRIELLTKEDAYIKLCEYIPENRKIYEQFIAECGLYEYPFAFSCIYQPMMEAYKAENMDLFRKYSEFTELILNYGNRTVAMAVDDEVVDRLNYDEPSSVWETFRNYVSPSFCY